MVYLLFLQQQLSRTLIAYALDELLLYTYACMYVYFNPFADRFQKRQRATHFAAAVHLNRRIIAGRKHHLAPSLLFSCSSSKPNDDDKTDSHKQIIKFLDSSNERHSNKELRRCHCKLIRFSHAKSPVCSFVEENLRCVFSN